MWWCGVAWRGVLWLCFMVPFGTDWKSSFKIERSSKVWSVLHKQGPACSAVPDSKMILRPAGPGHPRTKAVVGRCALGAFACCLKGRC